MFSEAQSVHSSSLLPMSYYQPVSPTQGSSCCIRIFLYLQCANLPQSQEVCLQTLDPTCSSSGYSNLTPQLLTLHVPYSSALHLGPGPLQDFQGPILVLPVTNECLVFNRDHRLSISSINLLHRVCVCMCVCACTCVCVHTRVYIILCMFT